MGPLKDQYVIINLTEVHLEPTLNVQTEEPELALLSSKENIGPAPESEFQRSILKVQDNWDQRTCIQYSGCHTLSDTLFWS